MVTHPLKEGTVVEGLRPSCSCRGAKQVPFKGAIKKIINGRNGIWYYLDTGVTVAATTVTLSQQGE